jgi:hypothetical protein
VRPTGKKGGPEIRAALIGAAVAVALTCAGTASAGCWATVGLSPPPEGTSAGELWRAELTVLQHGRNPLPDAASAAPSITILNRSTGERRKFTAKLTNSAVGRYEAPVVFPSAGAWSFHVFDGFTTWNGKSAGECARTHRFAPVQIGAVGVGPTQASRTARPDNGSFPLWSVIGGAGALLAAVFVGLYVLRRHTQRAPAAV